MFGGREMYSVWVTGRQEPVALVALLSLGLFENRSNVAPLSTFYLALPIGLSNILLQ